MKYLWMPEINVRPMRFGLGSQKSVPGSVYDERWV